MPGTNRSNSTVGSLGKAIRGPGLLDVLRMGVVPSKSQQLGSLIPRQEAVGEQDVFGTCTHFDINSLPRGEIVDDIPVGTHLSVSVKGRSLQQEQQLFSDIVL